MLVRVVFSLCLAHLALAVPHHRNTRAALQAVVNNASCHWHMRCDLDGVTVPGHSEVTSHLERIRFTDWFPGALTRAKVLDIGTTNGCMAFEMERRGAASVTAVDLFPPDFHCFGALAAALRSRVDFVRSTVYELPSRVAGRQYDIVFFFGVLYHLRHPLLALDSLYSLTADGGVAFVETTYTPCAADCAGQFGTVLFNSGSGWNGDPTNKFNPSLPVLRTWLRESGFDIKHENTHTERVTFVLHKGRTRPFVEETYERVVKTAAYSWWDEHPVGG